MAVVLVVMVVVAAGWLARARLVRPWREHGERERYLRESARRWERRR